MEQSILISQAAGSSLRPERHNFQCPRQALWIVFMEKRTMSQTEVRSSCCGAMVLEASQQQKDIGSIPGLAQWVQDPVLLQVRFGSDHSLENSTCHVVAKKQKKTNQKTKAKYSVLSIPVTVSHCQYVSHLYPEKWFPPCPPPQVLAAFPPE